MDNWERHAKDCNSHGQERLESVCKTNPEVPHRHDGNDHWHVTGFRPNSISWPPRGATQSLRIKKGEIRSHAPNFLTKQSPASGPGRMRRFKRISGSVISNLFEESQLLLG
jgi:hypothetical protein